MGGDALHDTDQLSEVYVGKVLRWWRKGWERTGSQAIVNDFLILWEAGDRMLVFSRNSADLRWMTHARNLLVHHSNVLELIDP